MIKLNLTREEFFARCFETRFHHQRAALREVVFGWKDVNELLYVMDPGAHGVRLFQDGPVDETKFVETYSELGVNRRRINKEALYRLMGEGGTLVMNRLELVSSTIRRLCMSVSELCGAPAIANGYVAFDGNGSFGKHWDTHDVFAVQLFGRKRWKLYEPTHPLPTRHQTSRHLKEFCPTMPVFDDVLEAGDVLYVPRGWWHEALPMGEETCHVAIGTHGPTLADYAVWCCQRYLRDHFVCRKSARLDDTASNNLVGVGEVVAEVIANRVTFEEFQRDLVASERLSTPFHLEHFVAPRRYPIDDETELQINSMLRVDVDRQFLSVNGAEAPRDLRIREVLGCLTVRSHMTIADMIIALPHLSAEEVRAAACALVMGNRALIRSGSLGPIS